jgi:AbrB family looped-hinge helix DNA binding protein
LVVTVTSKGQVTLPAEYRRLAKIETGSKLGILIEADGTARLKRKLTLDEVAGSLSRKYPGLSFTQDDIEAAITEAMDEQEERVRAEARAYKRKSRGHAA